MHNIATRTTTMEHCWLGPSWHTHSFIGTCNTNKCLYVQTNLVNFNLCYLWTFIVEFLNLEILDFVLVFGGYFSNIGCIHQSSHLTKLHTDLTLGRFHISPFNVYLIFFLENDYAPQKDIYTKSTFNIFSYGQMLNTSPKMVYSLIFFLAITYTNFSFKVNFIQILPLVDSHTEFGSYHDTSPVLH